MASSPLTGSRYPVGSDPAALATYYRQLALDLEGSTVPRFDSTASRDAAYTSWASAGYTLSDGMTSYAQNEDMLRVREGGTWRFAGYYGSTAGAATPKAHVKRLAFSAANGAQPVVTGWTVDRSHSAVTVDTTTGVITLNERGVWSVYGHTSSDHTTTGNSRIILTSSSAQYPLENLAYRGTGFSGAGLLKQPVAMIDYLDAGSTVTLSIGQNASNSAAVNYDVFLVLALIG